MKLSVSGKPEQSAGNIDITLTEESPTHVAYSGTTETSSGVERLNAAVHKKDDLQLLARGGNGHDGVRGANGRDGRDGRKGADATACMDAGPGENGTDGEPGQTGTDGGPAGDGGHIKITVGDADLALLGIIRETDVSAGTPGKAGSHGKGGKGGRGGQGGDQYMEYGSDHHHHHDSHHHYHPHHDMPHFIYRPQGSNGESGKDGFTPTTPLHPGKPGVNGTVNYYITSQGRVQSTHSEPYHLTMASLKLQSEQQSGLFEPGDTVYVTTEVYNQASTMPSPIEAMPVRLARDPVLMEKTAGEVAGNIPAGGVADNQLKPLSFVIDDPLIPEGYCSKPYVQKATVSARLMNTRLDRPYTESAAQTIEIRYPVELLDRQMHYAIGIDEELSLELEAKNISQKPLGAELGRDVFLQIIAPEYNVIEAKAVRRLEPGQSEKLTARVTMNAQQLYGSQTQYKANLLLQPIDRDKSVSLIQQQIFNVQLTPKYQLSESGFTLVINAETSPAAIQYWMEELTRIAQKPIAVWNTSYYGAFPLETIEKSLLAENPHGTVVVLDNEYTAANGKKVRNSEFVSKDNLLHAAQVHDSSIVIVGENKQLPESYKSDEPVLFWPEPVKHYTSLDSLVQDLLLDKPEDISHAKVTLPAETFFL